ncbi:hypothetical protein BDV95DRAFT_267027 [Massariosphaeria phaeospora]|uniref:Uncharacterized protein n=1 Tax=Massariosphaeria phaeospora TaxID=100035 RepID=A0A7C8I4J5_9PLEO|nr:hypothetical protein BDV95DRAFT_267027 [Massariosphaeria phaeospora]
MAQPFPRTHTLANTHTHNSLTHRALFGSTHTHHLAEPFFRPPSTHTTRTNPSKNRTTTAKTVTCTYPTTHPRANASSRANT